MASLRQLAIDVVFRGSKAVAGLKSVDKSVDKTKANFKNLGQGAINTGRMVDAFGRNTSFAQRALTTFNHGIDVAKDKAKQFRAEIQKTGNQLKKDFKQAVEDAKPGNMFEGFRTAGTVALAGGAVGAGVLGVGAKAAISFESAFAGVRKTVDATEEEYAQMRQQIRELTREIPAAHEEIAGVAEAAGQLGIQKEAIMGFTRTMVDLGVATNMTSDEAATALARLANITQMSEKDYDRLGSTIVALGNNLATTESEIVEMGLRLAGAGSQIGMSEAQILSFSGALSSVGIAAEAGGSAFSKVMIDMASEVATGGKNLANFAKVSGTTVAEFQQAFKDDAGGAIITFIEGLGRMSDAGEDVFGILDEMGLSEIRVRDSLLRASGAGDLFRKSMETGSQAWKENLALSNEAAERYATTESQLQLMKNTFKDISITLGDMLLPYINKGAQVIGSFVTKISNLPDGVKKFGVVALVATTALMLIIGPILLLLGFLPSIAAGFALIGSIGLSVLAPVALAIGAVTAAGVLLYKNWDKVKAVGLGLWNRFKTEIGPFVPYIQNVFNTIKTILQVSFNAMKNIFELGLVPLKAVFTVSWEIIKNTVGVAVETIGGVLGGLMQTLSGVIEFVAGVFTGDWARAWDGVKDIFGGILNGLEAIAKGAINSVIGIINAGISGLNKLKAPDWVPGIGGKSPNIPLIPKLAKGTNYFQGGLAVVGEEGPELVHLPRGSKVTPNKESIGTLKDVRSSGGDTFTFSPQISDGIKNLFPVALQAGVGVIQNVISGVKSLVAQMLQIGKNIVQGVVDGIKSKLGAVKQAAKDLSDAIGGKIKAFFGIRSPSKLMGEYGKNIGAGMALGIDKSIPILSKSVEGLNTVIVPEEQKHISKSVRGIASYTSDLTEPLSGNINYIGNVISPFIEPLKGVIGYIGEIIEPAVKQLKGKVLYDSQFTPPKIKDDYFSTGSMGTLKGAGGARQGDTFAPVIKITIEGGHESAQAAIPNIKREVERAIMPALEDYFYRLQLKRPSITRV